MKKLSTLILTLCTAAALAVPALADIAAPPITQPRNYIPIIIIAVAIIAVCVLIAAMRRAKSGNRAKADKAQPISGNKPEDK